MKLISLLNVLDGDTKIHIQFNRKEVFDGYAGDLIPVALPFTALESDIKAVWYSTTMNRIIIEV